MRVTLLASADFAVPSLQALIEEGHEVSVGTQPTARAGRGRRPRPTPVARRAEELGLLPRELEDVNDKESLDWLASTHPDLVAVVAFGQKLGPAVRAAGPWGCVNVHPSLLPRWRGAAPVPAAILGGDDETGVCVIDVVERMDAGAVLGQRTTRVGRKTAGMLLEELSQTGAELLVEVLDAMARDDVRRTPQDENRVTRARKLTPDDGRVRWEHGCEEVDRRVRAVTPWPGAHALLEDGRRLRLHSGEPVACPRGPLPGEVVESTPEGIVVACGEGAYRITRLQREGGKPLDADAFLRGFALPEGVRLGP